MKQITNNVKLRNIYYRTILPNGRILLQSIFNISLSAAFTIAVYLITPLLDAKVGPEFHFAFYILLVLIIDWAINITAGVFSLILLIILNNINVFAGISLASTMTESEFLGFIILGVLINLWTYVYKKRLKIEHQQNKKYRTLFDLSPLPKVLLDANSRIIFHSQSLQKVLQLKTPVDFHQKFADLLDQENKERFNRVFRSVVTEANSQKRVEVCMKQENDHNIWIQVEMINLQHDPNVRAIVAHLDDISIYKRYIAKNQMLLKREKRVRILAEQAVRSRDEFLSIASHELKTPLTTVILKLQSSLKEFVSKLFAS